MTSTTHQDSPHSTSEPPNIATNSRTISPKCQAHAYTSSDPTTDAHPAHLPLPTDGVPPYTLHSHVHLQNSEEFHRFGLGSSCWGQLLCLLWWGDAVTGALALPEGSILTYLKGVPELLPVSIQEAFPKDGVAELTSTFKAGNVGSWEQKLKWGGGRGKVGYLGIWL